MRRRLSMLLACGAIALAASAGAANAACPPRSTQADYVFGGGVCLAVSTYGTPRAGEAQDLVVVVHGDISDGGFATYHAHFAAMLARPGLVVVALVRPGYSGVGGRSSQGRNHAREDNYTAEAVNAMGSAVAALTRHHGARRVIYVGHSGGAAIGGVLIGRRPGLLDAAVLVSCPCDIARWLAARRRPAWQRSLSPTDVVHRVAETTRVVAITGSLDDNTTPDIARGYVARLAQRGLDAQFVEVSGATQGMSSLRAATIVEVERLLAPCRRAIWPGRRRWRRGRSS